jgi:hypothetical protein
LLQSSLPCSENFFRYKKNYEKFVGQNPGAGGEAGSPTGGDGLSELNMSSVSGDTSKSAAVKTIASPKIMTKSSPVNELWRRNNIKLTVDTAGARNALTKYAMGGGLAGAAGAKAAVDQPDSPIDEDRTNLIPIANFKSNKLSQIDKKQRQEEFERLKANPQPASPKMDDVIRLPN